MIVKGGGSPDRVRQRSRHRLFVEGSGKAFDVVALQVLLFELSMNILRRWDHRFV
ncbi:MAG: hypothetical protein HQL83_10685 [Magnetococcales bacterium]|nr:hypothetical protein [Magnetococcales bacterium]MBF0348905.1 hypothetical protein [Magnetococcales bacterium]MBF0630192.1 hypothetical protein [Magnetococcales bacterium]